MKLILSEETNTFLHTNTYEGPDSSFDTLSRVDLQVKLVRRKRLKKSQTDKEITFIEETFLKCNFLDETKEKTRTNETDDEFRRPKVYIFCRSKLEESTENKK